MILNGSEIAGELGNICSARGIQINPTRKEIKAAFAQRTKKCLKSIHHFYMEDYGCKYIHKLSRFVTTVNSGNKLIDRLDTKESQGF